jgi:rhamnogalacturonyl hydrolase YesR
MWTAVSEVEQLLAERATFDQIEAYIASRRDLTDDDRDALWLHAWAKLRTLEDRSKVAVRALLGHF